MARTNNYLLQAAQAKRYFLTYDQAALIRKLKLAFDDDYLYPMLFARKYRLSRKTGDLEREERGAWQDANTHEEVMTLLDLICDSKEGRFVSGRWKNMADFGHAFHQNLLEERDPYAELFQSQPEDFRKACEALGGEPLPTGDIAYSIEVFDGLPLAVQLWLGDEEFPARLRYLWDENALQYLKYETMYYARGLLLERLKTEMEAY
ncbi:MAG: DUF3786 domain-containing protein [Eubacteriales bacterium]|nr:DUF3786 domain-containing protein [Eubacteriales bacterium]